jgi:hypothetical protein
MWALLLAALVLSTGGSSPSTPTSWQEPYGGCAEAWQYPSTPGYRECHAHGYDVSPPEGWLGE